MTSAMQWSVENPVRVRAMIEVTVWADRYDSELSVGFYDAFLKSSEAVLRQVDVPLQDEKLHSVLRVYPWSTGSPLQMLTNGDKQRRLRDTATACAMLKAYAPVGGAQP
ncbi:hypothetical protein AB0K02_11130 [Streptomyces sp. NPDC049597]|uniref:hypothetical protein n=1 Tax=Streptomyces sp. NPDC049597 TaxID=3155276 RepID=UPI00343B3494